MKKAPMEGKGINGLKKDRRIEKGPTDGERTNGWKEERRMEKGPTVGKQKDGKMDGSYKTFLLSLLAQNPREP